MGHTFGPGSSQVLDKIQEVGGYVNDLITQFPDNTMIITFSDHGMHRTFNSEDKGNHGHLIDDDMVVFINIKIK